MKRAKEFVTLSWEHHDGLVFAFRLQQGLKNAADQHKMLEYIQYTWDNDLEHHFWQEEEILTASLEETERGRELLQTMLDDHRYFRERIKQFKLQSSFNPETIKEFADRLNQHIRFEEQKLFQYLEETLSPVKLKKIGDFLSEQHKQSDKCWTDQFWMIKSVKKK
jgi:hemerythrin-like domain-containing protein